MTIKIDPEFRDLIPSLSDEERAQLEANIKAEGCRDPLVVWNGMLLDGHNRYEICERLGLSFDTVNVELEDRESAIDWIERNQIGRRNLTADQRRYFIGRVYNRRKKARGAPVGNENRSIQRDQNEPFEKTADRVAKDFGVSAPTVKRAAKFAEEVDSDNTLKTAVQSGESVKDVLREKRKAAQKAKIDAIKSRPVDVPTGEYDVVVVDPPWHMEKIERDVAPNQVGFDYPTMDEEELEKLHIPAARDCHMWLWTTHKFLPMALRLLKAWGFKYVCTFTWHKPGGFQPFGLPQYNSEFALYARKGAPQFVETKQFFTAFEAPRTKHSEKPEKFYDIVRRVTAGRRVDMFNRRSIEGFDVWGNEANGLGS